MMVTGALVRERRGRAWFGPWHAAGHVARSEFEHASSGEGQRTHGRSGLVVYLSTALCRFLLMPPVKGVKSLRDYQMIATHAFADRLGLKPVEWQVRVDPGSSLGVVACAVRHETLALAKGLALHLSQPLHSVRPWAAVVLARVTPRGSARRPTLIFETDGVLLLGTDAEGGPQLRSLPPSASVVDALGTLGIEVSAAQQFGMAVDDSSATKPPRNDFLDLLVERSN